MKTTVVSRHVAVGVSALIGIMLMGSVQSAHAQTTGTIVSDLTVRARILKEGRAIDPFVRTGNAHAIFTRFNPQMAQAVTESSVQQILKDVLSQAPLGDLLGDSVRTDGNGTDVYEAEYTWGTSLEYVEADFDTNGQISGLMITGRDALPLDPMAGRLTKGVYRLPFNGTWWVFWGGNTDIQNYHVVAPDQRHAYDIVIAKDGKDYHDSPNENRNYYDFGQHILAPVNATVVEAVDGIAENVPGSLNADKPAGNHVILDCGNGEYLVMAHFKDHSIRVKTGDKVTKGEFIAECGNTGNSSEPHLHIHLQNGPTLFKATGLPLVFTDFTVGGKSIMRGELLQGQFVKAVN